MRQSTKKKGKGRNGIRYYIYSGVLMALPVSVTVWFVVWVIRFFDDLVLWALPKDSAWQNIFSQFPGYGLLATLVFLFLLGLLMRTLLGEKIVHLGDSVMARMPVVGAVYATSQKIAQALVGQNSNDLRKVALLEYPKEGMWCLCFVTGEAPQKVCERFPKEKDLASVFVPTAPNPTSGILLVVPLHKLIILDMPADEGMRFIVTAGMSEQKGEA